MYILVRGKAIGLSVYRCCSTVVGNTKIARSRDLGVRMSATWYQSVGNSKKTDLPYLINVYYGPRELQCAFLSATPISHTYL